MSNTLQIVEAIARQAGAVLMEGFGHVRHVQQKGVIDLVTEFDKRAEEVIVPAIQKEFPDHAILAEESGQTGAMSEWNNQDIQVIPLRELTHPSFDTIRHHDWSSTSICAGSSQARTIDLQVLIRLPSELRK